MSFYVESPYKKGPQKTANRLLGKVGSVLQQRPGGPSPGNIMKRSFARKPPRVNSDPQHGPTVLEDTKKSVAPEPDVPMLRDRKKIKAYPSPDTQVTFSRPTSSVPKTSVNQQSNINVQPGKKKTKSPETTLKDRKKVKKQPAPDTSFYGGKTEKGYPYTKFGYGDGENKGTAIPSWLFGPDVKDTLAETKEAYKKGGLGSAIGTYARGTVGDAVGYLVDNPVTRPINRFAAGVSNAANSFVTGDKDAVFTTPQPQGQSSQQEAGTLPAPPEGINPNEKDFALNQEIDSGIAKRNQGLAERGVSRSVKDGVETLTLNQGDGGYGSVSRRLGQPQGNEAQPASSGMRTVNRGGYSFHGSGEDAGRFFAPVSSMAGTKRVQRHQPREHYGPNTQETQGGRQPIRTFGDILNVKRNMAEDKLDLEKAKVASNAASKFSRDNTYAESVAGQNAERAANITKDRFAINRQQQLAQFENQYLNEQDEAIKAQLAEQIRVLSGDGKQDTGDEWETKTIEEIDPETNMPVKTLVQVNQRGEMRYPQEAGAGGGQYPPLPDDVKKLKKGQIYPAGLGNLRWNGKEFEEVN